MMSQSVTTSSSSLPSVSVVHFPIALENCTFRVVTPARDGEMIKNRLIPLKAKVFSRSPWEVALGITSEHLMEVLPEYSFHITEEEMTIVAFASIANHSNKNKRNSSNENSNSNISNNSHSNDSAAEEDLVPIGFCFNDDYLSVLHGNDIYKRANNLMTAQDEINSKIIRPTSVMAAFVDEIEYMYYKNHWEKRGLQKGQLFHLNMVGVDERYPSKGLATELCRKTIELAREKGYTAVVATAANSITTHILVDKLGFKIVERVDYATWEWKQENRRPLAVVPLLIPSEKECQVVELQLLT